MDDPNCWQRVTLQKCIEQAWELEKMKAQPGSSANFGAIELVGAPITRSQPAQDLLAKPLRSRFVIVFVAFLVSVMVLWIAFLVWLVIRTIF
jgi:hypothetical protein